ncbi:hypothetical protein M569_10920 [Genlisea aurea]|uniref:PUM-HD domain-containing protein n=1 Tax=Genlisea aurea TaxID=192259 RepID=S8CAF1_9LAMI|nr:hypothetical protein M569_10920 [Genlisea aurea]
MGRFPFLSMNKFSSNVVEKCLRVADQYQRLQIVNELINGPDFSNLLVNPFGNYVVQSAIKTTSGGMRQLVIKRVMGMSSMIKGDMYGRRVLACAKLLR